MADPATAIRHACLALALLTAMPGVVPGAIAQGANAPAQAPAPGTWPRDIQLGSATVTIHQPQVEKWEGDTLQFRAALSARQSGGTSAVGVLWADAHTEVDRATRKVTLSNLALTRIRMPTLDDHGEAYLRELRQDMPNAIRTIELDRLQASLAAGGQAKSIAVPVRNDPPRIIVSTVPAVLIPFDGDPVLKPTADGRFQRIMNTRALVLRDASGYYLHLYDGWMTARSIDGPWNVSRYVPPGMDALAADLAKSGQVDLLDGSSVEPRRSLARGAPVVYTSRAPAELIVFNGRPVYRAVNGTRLLWGINTVADVIVDAVNQGYYVLISGRWYRARALEGPWSFVASNALPADFARIPTDEPMARVLGSVAGTPQAQAALIENSIPQTVAVPLANAPEFNPTFDGAPQLRRIEGTPLRYVANSPDPILQVDANSHYAVRNGVWYAAARPTGPWRVADSVPPVVHTIPPSSPLHYVTYVHVYHATPTTVHTGYTQGYLGTVATPHGVVYGTGHRYAPWVGSAYYGAPATFGVAAYPVFDAAARVMLGYAFGAGTGALLAPRWGPYYDGFSAASGCCLAASGSHNVYGRLGPSVVTERRTDGYAPAARDAAVRANDTAEIRRTSTATDARASQGAGYRTAGAGNDHYADASGNVYRNTGGNWQKSAGDGWESARPEESSSMTREAQARSQGEQRAATLNRASPEASAAAGGGAHARR